MVEEKNNVSEEERKKLDLIENILEKISFIKQLNDRDNINNEITNLENDLNTQIKADFSEKYNELVKEIIKKLINVHEIDTEIFDHINKLNQDSYEYKLLKKLTFYSDSIEVRNQYALRFKLKIVKTYRETNYTLAEYSIYPPRFNLFYNDLSTDINSSIIEIMKSLLKFLKKIEDELITP